MSPTLISLAVIVIVLSLIYWWRRRHLLKITANLSGPPTVPFFGNALYFISKDLTECFRIFVAFMEKYGPIVRLWFGPKLVILIKDPQHIDKVVEHDKLCTRGPYVRMVLKPMFRNGLLSIDGDIWRKHRKIITAQFQNNIVDKFVDSFAMNSSILSDRLMEVADGNFHDIYMYFTLCTMDVIVSASLGYKLNAQINNDIEIVNSLVIVLDHISDHFLRPWLHFDWVHKLTKSCVRFKNGVAHLNSIALDVINVRKDLHKDMKAAGQNIEADKMENPLLIDTLLQNSEYNIDDIMGEITTISGAGAETTSSTCCYALALLCENQDIQEKLLVEQRDIFGDDFHRPVTLEDLPKMVYLEQVIKETLRVFPPLPFHFRETVSDVDLGNGHILPQGSLVNIMAYLTHRNPEYYPDPDRFDPDRFLPSNCIGRHPYAYIPFGLGRRLCVGHYYAMMEVKTILSTVLRKYRVCAVEGGIEALEKTMKFGLILKPLHGFRISMVPRSSS